MANMLRHLFALAVMTLLAFAGPAAAIAAKVRTVPGFSGWEAQCAARAFADPAAFACRSSADATAETVTPALQCYRGFWVRMRPGSPTWKLISILLCARRGLPACPSPPALVQQGATCWLKR